MAAHIELITDSTFRQLAEDSFTRKRFHCEGAAVLADGESSGTRLIVFYQTLCDYLDTLTDRGPRLSSQAVGTLHQALFLALDEKADVEERDLVSLVPDQGYLAWLVRSCQREVHSLPGLDAVRPLVRWLAGRYGELQSLKHDPDRAGRGRRLESWADRHNQGRWPIDWWELAAATGSTLGLFALLREAAHSRPDQRQIDALAACYFPWIGGLHILLDYLVDQDEDRAGHDFNFIHCYADDRATAEGLSHLFAGAEAQVGLLPQAGDHRWILTGLPTFYLADGKARRLPRQLFRHVLRLAGGRSHWWLPLARISRSP